MATAIWPLKNGPKKINKKHPDRFRTFSPLFACFRLFLHFFSLVLAFFGRKSTIRAEMFSEYFQKTQEGCVCFRGLFGGSRGKLRESPGKIAGNFFRNREMLQILGFRAPGKANLPGTLGRHCLDLVPTFRAGCLLKLPVPAFSSFSD